MPDVEDLNEGQQKATDAFFNFLFTKDKEFNISGSAGTGKTYLMSHFIDKIIPRYYEMCKLMGIKPEYHTVMMTATTNKAAEVLAEITKRPTETIHSFLRLKVMEDYSSGRTTLTKRRDWKIHENIVLFIDEASMIDSSLYPIIQEGTMNCKIIYVGDHNQLTPVGEKLSPVYKQNTPFYVFG